MIDRSYLLVKRPTSSSVRREAIQHLFPLLVNGVGAVEVRLELVAGAVRRAPTPTLMAGAAGGFILGWLLRPRRR